MCIRDRLGVSGDWSASKLVWLVWHGSFPGDLRNNGEGEENCCYAVMRQNIWCVNTLVISGLPNVEVQQKSHFVILFCILKNNVNMFLNVLLIVFIQKEEKGIWGNIRNAPFLSRKVGCWPLCWVAGCGQCDRLLNWMQNRGAPSWNKNI